MIKRIYLLSLVLTWSLPFYLLGETLPEPKHPPIVNGYVKDSQTGEILIGATVYVSETQTGTATNLYGFYSLPVEAGEATLSFKSLGYKQQQVKLSVTDDLTYNILLEPESAQLNEVRVVANQTQVQLDNPIMGVQKIQAKTIKSVPALMGEVDPIKVLQLLPGIQAASEGSTGFSVRGGNPDQNLILLDEAIVYNAGHMMGFFSVFNNDAIKDVNIYKGDIPARSGGRLSSLLDIRMKDGNSQRFTGSGGIGILSSRLTLEGPLGSDKTTFLLSGRRTYADLFLPLSSDESVQDSKLYFYDVNAKISHTFSDKDRLFVSGYMGRDMFSGGDMAMSFGNQTLTMRWNHIFSPRLFGNVTAMTTNYDYQLSAESGSSDDFKWISNLRDYNLKMDFNYYPNTKNAISFGLQTIYHNILPAHVKGTSDNTVFNELKLPRNRALEHGLYAENTQKVTDQLTLRYGIRLSGFQNIGKGVLYGYDQNYEVNDTTRYGAGDVFNTYWNWEPRLGATYMINPITSVKASYSRSYQYLHMASNSRSTTPLDVWFTSSPNVKPQKADQYSVGIFRHLNNEKMDFGVEGFYKNMKNTIDFKDYAELLLNEYLEGELRFGKSYAYGMEFISHFNFSRWNGWVSYTLSQTKRKIEGINNNNWYLSPYDHTHDCSLVLSFKASERVSISGNWVYYTGAPVTFPVGRFESGGNIVPIYSDRNAERMPDYHRLDLAVTIRNRAKPGQRWHGEWNFSLYNAYGQKNAWSISFVEDEDEAYRTKAIKTYLFTFVPSVTYNFKF
ncbi:TonB-dependent receptor [Geofilum sp. OHC36d9]|uniref:TonB-dependent receptor n=1 Tax=Geofilum sp. OHC36d9 TaxID=3458413 RepID=UPI004033F74E